jgi:hypothetical protein
MTSAPHCFGAFQRKLEILELTVPPTIALTVSPLVGCISSKQLKLFQIPETLKRMKRKLKPEEHEAIVSAVAAGDRIKAKNIYLSATEGNLTEAQNFIKSLIVESETAGGGSVIRKVTKA